MQTYEESKNKSKLMVTGWNKMLKSIQGWLICSSFTHYLEDKHLLLCQIFDIDLPLLAFSRHMLRKPSLTPCLIILFALNNLRTYSFLFSLATVFLAKGTEHTGKLELTNFKEAKGHLQSSQEAPTSTYELRFLSTVDYCDF